MYVYCIERQVNNCDIILNDVSSRVTHSAVTGLPIFASRESLYTEKGWQTLQNRHYAAKMLAMFNIYNGYAPPYSI